MKALIAMSGGVDSSVAAFLTQKEGITCIGGMARMCGQNIVDDSSFTQSIRDAQTIAARLGIEFHIFDATDTFQRTVVEDFIHCYEQGITPNPCIQCNKHVKFSYLLDRAAELDCDCIVTGHYARIRQDQSSGRYLLYKAVDESKDQSYFLACLNQHQLSRTILPLGQYTKAEIREIAENQGFVNAKKRDSQDICFIPDGDYKAFISRFTGKTFPVGNYLDLQGNVVGKHNGAIGYTLGQRKGLCLSLGTPVYVCSKDMAANTVTVGPEEKLFTNTLLAKDWNWIPFPTLTAPMRVMAKARYRHTLQPATVFPDENGIVRVVFDTPQRAITPGQTVVLYDGNMVVGSGIITDTF